MHFSLCISLIFLVIILCISIHPFYPEFLVVFDSISAKDLILRGGSIKTDRFLLLRQWSRLSLAISHPLRFRVELSLEGIPIHA